MHKLHYPKVFEKKKVTEHKTCVIILSTNIVWNIFIVIKIEWDITKM
jgi:hypothetical protein